MVGRVGAWRAMTDKSLNYQLVEPQKMKYYSTKNKINRVSFREAVLTGIAADGGLFMPEIFPVIPAETIAAMSDMTLAEIALKVVRPFVQPLDDTVLETMVRESINFSAPIKELSDTLKIVELWHGPTLAFKDFGARFLARMLSWTLKEEKKNVLILVATSGDTGSAVAQGFYGMPGITVGLLYPKGKVSWIQEKQLTTVGGNVYAFEVDGSFDDCQRLAKHAFADCELHDHFYLTSANSINICRLLPQMFYYFFAVSRMHKQGRPVVVCVPCGNFGNLTAGLIAGKMGLPVERYIAAVNANRVFAEFMKSGNFVPRSAIPTISNAMDVGDPSNFYRIWDLFNGDIDMMRRQINSYSIDDTDTKSGIREMWEQYDYLIDPHGAVGYQAIKQHRKNNRGDYQYILLETAHPAKFKDIMETVIDAKIEMPEQLGRALEKDKTAIAVKNTYEDFRQQLMHSIAG